MRTVSDLGCVSCVCGDSNEHRRDGPVDVLGRTLEARIVSFCKVQSPSCVRNNSEQFTFICKGARSVRR
jgi:hypothetical protein